MGIFEEEERETELEGNLRSTHCVLQLRNTDSRYTVFSVQFPIHSLALLAQRACRSREKTH